VGKALIGQYLSIYRTVSCVFALIQESHCEKFSLQEYLLRCVKTRKTSQLSTSCDSENLTTKRGQLAGVVVNNYNPSYLEDRGRIAVWRPLGQS
jgi:hypothetical protein